MKIFAAATSAIQTMAMTQRCRHGLFSTIGCSPPSCARYFGNESAGVKAIRDPADLKKALLQ
jgi:hypothetical protein